MRRRPFPLLRRLTSAIILSACLIVPFRATGANTVRNLNVVEAEDMKRFVFLLDGEPRYDLKSVEGKGLFLTLHDTAGTPLLNERIDKAPSVIAIAEKEKPSDLTFHILSTLPLRDIGASWLSQRKLFVLETVQDKERKKRDAKQGAGELKRVRFGVKETMTRMVMDLGKKPQWEISYRQAERMTLTLSASRGNLKQRRYGPFRRIEGIEIRDNDRGQEIELRLEKPLIRFRTFWLRQGHKLVLDLFDRPSELTDEIRPVSEERAEGKRDRNQVDRMQETGAKADSGVTNRVDEEASPKTKEARAKSDDEVREKDPPGSETGFRVRKKIPQRDGTAEAQERKDPPPVHPAQPVSFGIDLQTERILSERFPSGTGLDRLSSKEAFLFGRIQEAWEIMDFEKGASLTNQFLKEFPGSPIGERIAFLGGDFRLALLKGGRTDLLPQVIREYQDAMRRFRKSGEIPGAFVKMAQANAAAGKNFEAIGFLNIGIGQYPEGAHLPLAYLTRGKLYLATHQPEKAVQDFRTIMTRFPRSSQREKARFWTANYLLSVGLYDEADRTLEEIEKADPEFYLEQPEYLSLRARNYFYQKRYDEARDCYFRALNLGRQPEKVDLLLSHIGDTYHHQTRERAAEKFYRAALDRYPDSEGASIAKLRLAGYSSGVTLFKEIHETNPNSPIGDLALLKLANRFYEKGAYSMAMDTLRKVMEKTLQADIQRESRELYRRAAEKEIHRLYRAGEHKDLVRFYRSVKHRVGKEIDPEAVYLVARALHKEDLYREAAALFSEIGPWDLNLTTKGEYFLSLADCHMKLGDWKRAEDLLVGTMKTKLLPTDHQKMAILLADLRKKRGDLDNAYRLYETEVKGKRSLPDIEIARVYLSMGEIASKQKRYDQSIESLNRCIALAEKEKGGTALLRSALVELGDTFHREGKHRQAVKAYERGLEHGYGPQDGGFWGASFRLALSYLETGKEEEAKRLLREIADEGDPLLQQKVLIKLGQMDLMDQLKRLPIWREGMETL